MFRVYLQRPILMPQVSHLPGVGAARQIHMLQAVARLRGIQLGGPLILTLMTVERLHGMRRLVLRIPMLMAGARLRGMLAEELLILTEAQHLGGPRTVGVRVHG